MVDESYPEQSFDFGTQSWDAQVSKTLSSGVFTVGNELKLLKITVTGKVNGKGNMLESYKYNAELSVTLPSGGRYLRWNTGGDFGFINGGTVVYTRSVTSGSSSSVSVNSSGSFYITRIS